MRLFFIALVFSWTIGVIIGLHSTSYYVLLLVAGMLSVIFSYWQLNTQVSVACLALFLLGSLYGTSQTFSANGDCLVSEKFEGSISSVLKRESMSAQYLVNGSDGCTLLVVTARWPQYDPGNIVVITGQFQPIGDIPPEYGGYAKYLERRGISATVRYPQIFAQDQYIEPKARIINNINQHIFRVFAEPEASIVSAMLLGDSGSIPEVIEENFRRTGISHILAISGQNMSLLAALLLLVLLILPISPIARTCSIVLFLWLYVGLLGFPVSATRAVVFWTVALSAWHINGLVSLPTIIIMALVAMITFDPSVTTDVGWQLSFAAVVGIGLALFLVKIRDLSGLKLLILSTLGATLTTYPISLYHFGSIALISLATNLLVLPVTGGFMILSIATVLLSYIVPMLSVILSYGVHIIWQWIDIITGSFATIPGAYLEEINTPWWVLLIWYGGLILIANFIIIRQGRRWQEIWQ